MDRDSLEQTELYRDLPMVAMPVPISMSRRPMESALQAFQKHLEETLLWARGSSRGAGTRRGATELWRQLGGSGAPGCIPPCHTTHDNVRTVRSGEEIVADKSYVTGRVLYRVFYNYPLPTLAFKPEFSRIIESTF